MSKNSEQTARVNLIINGQSANANLRDLEAAARKLKSELAGLHPSDARFNQTAENYRRINQQLQNTRVQAGLTMSAWQKMKSTITATFVGTFGSNLATLGLQQISGYISDAWQNAKKLSDQFADIRKTTGMTSLEVLKLNRELGKINTRTSMSDLREIAKVGGQFGVAKDQILGFVEAVDKTTIALGDEFGGGAEQVASEMSKLRNILLDIKSDNVGADIGFISNAINALASAGIATGPVVADLANRIGGYGSQIGLTSGEILGLSATLQELGVTAERGGTAVVKILQKMLTNSAEFARIAGMELGEFEKLLNDDIYGAFVKVMEGSKNMGQSSTLLAAIIKDLEVQGAGASEIFAKLGGNTQMLQEKVDLAGSSLTNLNSITEEANLRNENLAGSVERLSKRYEKLLSNSVLQTIFKGFVDFSEKTLGMFENMLDNLKYTYRAWTLGIEETNKIYAKQTIAMLEEQEKKVTQTRVQGYINGIKQMNSKELEAEKTRLENAVKFNVKLLEIQRKKGRNSKQSELTMELAYENRLQLDALNEFLKTKTSKTLSDKRKLTDEELKEEKRRNDAITKEQDSLAKERKGYEDARAAYEKELWQKQMFEQIDALKELAKMEKELGDDSIDAEMERLEKMAQLNKETADDIANYNREKLIQASENMQEIGYAMLDTFGTINNLIAARDQNELNNFKKSQDEKLNKLEQSLEKGLITEEQYQAQKTALEQQALAKENEIRLKEARSQKAMAIFDSAMKAAMAWVKAAAFPLVPIYTVAAIAATAQAGLIAATPLPQFAEGGYTGNESGGGIDGKGGFNAILHPNEYVINSKLMQDPFVYRFTEMLENKSQSISTGMQMPGQNLPSPNYTIDNRLIEILDRIEKNGVKGVWDWDYEQRTRDRMAELDNRRKM